MTARDVRPLLDACVHCGLCLPACPTYLETGNELDSPRGRIDLVRGLTDGTLADAAVAADHLDRCLGCRACEPACPSGVRYGAIVESARDDGRAAGPRPLSVRVALRVLASPAATVAASRAAWVARRFGLVAVAQSLGVVGADVAPDAAWTPWSRTVPDVLPATAPRRGAVALLPGCVMDQGFPGVHAASAACLRAAGYDVRIPRGPLCCGALHAHVGDTTTADACGARLAAQMPRDVDAWVTDAAGCGSRMKEAAPDGAPPAFDVLEFLDRHGLRAKPRPISAHFEVRGRLRVAYADPCHLAHAQGVRDAPRRLLASIPDVDLVPIRDADRCCGSAGVYNLAQPAMARALRDAKVECLREVSPDVVATANPGCHLQIAAGLREAGIGAPVRHVVELLAMTLAA